MQRDFVVCVKEIKYDEKANKFLTKYENINVLVGPQASIDALKKEIETFLANFKGTFKTDYRVRPM